jgi:fructose-1,6-bisphosphatase/inositol monophosphatase family enzyme
MALDQILMSEYGSICREATEWVRQGGRLALQYFGAVEADRKADHSYVTEADHAVQAMLLEAIARRFSTDAVISEETQADPKRHGAIATAKRCWVVDPIDGTRSFTRGFPGFCISLALLESGMPVVGLIYSPLTDHVYSAVAGGGAFLNGKNIRARDAGISSDCLMAIPSRRRGKLVRRPCTWLCWPAERWMRCLRMNAGCGTSLPANLSCAKRVRAWFRSTVGPIFRSRQTAMPMKRRPSWPQGQMVFKPYYKSIAARANQGPNEVADVAGCD